MWRKSVNSKRTSCIDDIENQLCEISDEENLIAQVMLDAGMDCNQIIFALKVQRRKKSFIRKLVEHGIKGQNQKYLVEKFMDKIQSGASMSDLAQEAKNLYDAQRAKQTVQVQSEIKKAI